MAISGNSYSWLKVAAVFLFILVLFTFIFIFYIVNPCDNQEDVTNCKDQVESFLIILYLLAGFTLFTGGIGVVLFLLEFFKSKS